MNNLATAPSNVTLDDHVEDELAGFLSLEKPTSFFLFAGAGSGKTRSLVNALNYLAKTYRDVLRLRGRQVAVITYTNAACDEITRRTEYDPLFMVRTIHSFAWSQIQGFNSDIRAWLKDNLQREIADLQAEETKGRAGTKASAARQAQIESKQRRLDRLIGGAHVPASGPQQVLATRYTKQGACHLVDKTNLGLDALPQSKYGRLDKRGYSIGKARDH